MASAAATQVGTYFLRNYYNLLQQNPDVVHQFYSDASTMVRVDDLTGTNTTANTMMSWSPGHPPTATSSLSQEIASKETHLLFDLYMMYVDGVEREEHDRVEKDFL